MADDAQLLRPGEDPATLDQVNPLNGLTRRQVREAKFNLGFEFSNPAFSNVSFKQYVQAVDPNGDIGIGSEFNKEVVKQGGQAQSFNPDPQTGVTDPEETIEDPTRTAFDSLPEVVQGLGFQNVAFTPRPEDIAADPTRFAGPGSQQAQGVRNIFGDQELQLLGVDNVLGNDFFNLIEGERFNPQNNLIAFEAPNGMILNVDPTTGNVFDFGTGEQILTDTGRPASARSGGLVQELLALDALTQELEPTSPATADPTAASGGATAGSLPEGVSAEQAAALAALRDDRLAENQRSADQALIDEALQGALGDAQRFVTGRGLNFGEFENDILRALERQAAGIPLGADNPLSFFDPNTAANVLTEIENARRGQFLNQVNAFAPTGFATNLLPDTLDDDIILSILDEQFAPAQQNLERQKARGLLSDLGFNIANQNLTNQRSAGQERLTTIGGDILSGVRSDLEGIASQAREGAQNFTLGSSFDPTSFQSQIDTRVAEAPDRLEGQIRGALGGENLFDTNTAVQTGAAGQGVTNLRGSLFDALNTQRKSQTSGRGLGTQGVF